MRYNKNDSYFSEELLAHARDILVNPKKREHFEKFVGENSKSVISALKAGHQKAYNVAMNLRPEDVGAERKISPKTTKLAASEEMKKGSARRIFGGIDASNLPGRDEVNEWQTSTLILQDKDSSYDDEIHQAARRDIPRMEEGLRLRALNKLSNRTLTRKHPETGKRQFLLFRGVGPNERKAVLDGGFVQHDDHSSWTPHISTAKGFESDYHTEDGPAKTIAAWVDEDNIHAAPHMYGKMPHLQMDMDNAGEFYTPGKNFPGKNEYSIEHEIIVAPHTSDRATKGDVKRYQAIHSPTRTKIAQTDPKKDLHGRINYRGEQDKSGFRSTKQYPLIRETKPLPSAVKDIIRTTKAPKKMAASEEGKKDNNIFSRKHVENHIASLYAGAHDEDEDFNSGIPDFHASDFYKLQSIPIDQVNKENAPSKDLVRKYKNLYQKGMNFPPIVLSKLNNEIMDGRHRVQAAKELGLTHIHAYVPVKEKNE